MNAVDLRALLTPECVLVGEKKASKEELFEAMIDALSGRGIVADAEGLLRELMERERLAPTGIGASCAIPHAHSGTARETALAVAVLGEPIDFGSPEGDKAAIVVMMVGPEGAAAFHLKLLSKIARFLHDESFRKALLAAPDPEAAARAFYDKDERS